MIDLALTLPHAHRTRLESAFAPENQGLNGIIHGYDRVNKPHQCHDRTFLMPKLDMCYICVCVCNHNFNKFLCWRRANR
jgi:hypothetical protein